MRPHLQSLRAVIARQPCNSGRDRSACQRHSQFPTSPAPTADLRTRRRDTHDLPEFRSTLCESARIPAASASCGLPGWRALPRGTMESAALSSSRSLVHHPSKQSQARNEQAGADKGRLRQVPYECSPAIRALLRESDVLWCSEMRHTGMAQKPVKFVNVAVLSRVLKNVIKTYAR